MSETSIKKKLYISATPAATNTLPGYTALTWVKVAWPVTIGQLGFNHATIEIPNLETGITKTAKGARSGTGGQIAFKKVSGDAGQAAVKTANEAETEVSIQVVDPDGVNATFWTGIIHSLIDNESSNASYEGQSFTFVPNAEPIVGAADVAP